jgi:photosystem I P700 chlorophyll a apoprotein A1
MTHALGRPADMFSDTAIQLHLFSHNGSKTFLSSKYYSSNALASTSPAWGGDVVAVGGKVAMMPISLGTADFMVHHIHAFTIHVTVLILLKVFYMHVVNV